MDGEIVGAAQEERFTRRKHDSAFPKHAIQYCLDISKSSLGELDGVVFYDKPLIKFERLLETYMSYAPFGIASFLAAMPVWLKEKLFLKTTLKRELAAMSGLSVKNLPKLLFTEHHQAHAASAFFPSPFSSAAVLCMDGVGEWATTSVWRGSGNKLTPLWEIDFPHSIGLLYSAFTYYTGFKVNSGEYKLMGLAPYGEPEYKQLIMDNLIDVKDDGTFRLDMSYFNYAVGLTMTTEKFHRLFGGPPRRPESALEQRHMNLARSIQDVTEEIVIRMARTVRRETNERNLCLAGGVALNCVANGKLLREGIFDEIYIQPAAGDAGGSLGAALSAMYEYAGAERVPEKNDSMKGSYLGPQLSRDEIKSVLDSRHASYTELSENELYAAVSDILSKGLVVGWVRGRMEFGPRALGSRSIIGDARDRKMQSTMNLKVKYRESFRPFAPAVLAERVSDYFELETKSPYMLLVAPVKESRRIAMTSDEQKLFGIDKLKVPRSEIPAVTHVDYTARVQTVHPETNPAFYRLLRDFESKTGCGVLVNTSFNVRGEPIVCTAEDAYRCFMRTEMDYLVIENFLIAKKDQPPVEQDRSWEGEFALD